MNSKDKFVTLPSGKIFTKTWNPEPLSKGSTPIFLLHDSLGCVDTWRELPAKIASENQCPVIAYDRLGFGKSSRLVKLPSIHFISEEFEVFQQILKELKIKSYILFGHSVGGAMALIIASQDPNCLGVITESAQAFVEPLTREGIQKAKLDFTNQERFEKLKKYHGEKSEWVLNSWSEIWLSETFANWSLKNEIKKINCPVLCIHGDHDEYGSLAFPEIITSLVTPFDDSPEKKIIANCGHIPHKEYERLVLDYIHSFLKKTKKSQVKLHDPNKTLIDFMKVFAMPFLVNKVFMLYFGLNYSNHPGEGYGYGLIATVFVLFFTVGRFLWKYKDIEDP